MQSIVLWLFVLNLGVAFGAGLYEHRIVASRWVTASADGAHWRADLARRDDPGRRFWAFVTTIPLTLLTLANLYAAWHAAGIVRSWWLAAACLAFVDRALTFAYFIPTMVGLMKAADSAESAGIAIKWWRINYLRHAFVLAAWLASLKAFALWHAH
jgi:putative effector of murein hydrolase LrgA (UPF0299 family)